MKITLLKTVVGLFMRLSVTTFIVLFASGIVLADRSDAQNISRVPVSLDLERVPIVEAFEAIEAETSFKFIYDKVLTTSPEKVTVHVSNEPLEEVLGLISAQTGLLFKQMKKTIAVSTGERGLEAPMQEREVSGAVTDTTGAGLPGVSVFVKDEPGTGTGTDINGKYILSVPADAILVFSLMGYQPVEVPVNGRAEIDVVMRVEDSRLEEVVVVGYGTQKKISLIGAQSSVEASDLKLPVANLTTSLGGRLAGVVSVQRSGEPGFDDADIWIRGISTFSENLSKPLVLVDGVPRPFANVDPEDIESFTILKDASATAIYGVRGANGVILVTTKKGTIGKPQVRLRYNEGITSFTRVPEFADGVTYMEMSNEALTSRDGVPRYSQEAIEATRNGSDPYLYPNVDWYGELFKDYGHTRSANLNITGGSDRMQYYLGTGYYDETGLYETDDLAQYNSQVGYKRYNLTANLTLQPTRTTDIDLGVQGFLANANYPGASASSIFEKAFFMTPIIHPVKYEDGRIADIATSNVQNPYALLTQTGYANQWRNRLFSNLRVTQQMDFLLEGLSATAMFSFDVYNYTSLRRTKTPDTWLANGRDEDGNLEYQLTRTGTEFLDYARNSNGSRSIYTEAALNYSKEFGDHQVGAMLLYNQSDEIDTQADNFTSSLPFRFRGLAGRATYAFKNKYFVEANFGYNGSENFLPEKRYGFFPSGGVGWVLSEESFFEPLENVFQFFKLRFTHGIVGSSNISGRRFAYMGTVDNTSGYTFGKNFDRNISGKDIGEYAVNVTWETSTKTNLGIDLWTLNSALNLQVDLFRERREGIFLRRQSLPDYVGMRNNPYGNVGVIENEGIDGSITYSGKIGRVNLQLIGNLTFARNKVIEDDLPDWEYPWLERKGRKVGQRFGYIALGFFESEEEIANSPSQTGDVRPGDLKFKDLNGDGRIDAYDQYPIGYGDVPEIVYGFGFTVGYRAFSLSTLFQGVGNMDIWLNGEGLIPFQQGLSRGNLFSNIEDRWTVENPDPNAFYPRLAPGTINDNYTRSTWWIENGKYLRLKTLQLAYRLPETFLDRLRIENASVFFSGVNLLTFSPFTLWDVELGDGSDSAYPGGAMYPNVATYSVGVDFTF